MKSLNNRNQLADLLNKLGLVGEAAFVGVAEAYFESYFLERWPGRASWIDPYRILATPGFSGHGEDSDAGQEARYQRVLRTAQKFGPRCKVIRATSEEAAPRFADGSLDFCYLDAAHNYESIQQDIALWVGKVGKGKILAGHDWVEDGIHNGQPYGVRKAVSEFAAANNLTINTTQDNDWPSWWIRREP